MNEGLLRILTITAALGCGLVGGIFFAFSTFVMKALDRLPPAQGIAAMQSINIVVINPVFMAAFLGTGMVCAVLGISSLLDWQRPGSGFVVAGSLLYVVGTVLVTMVFNVPRNNALAAVDPTSAEGAHLWASYVTGWTFWNHVRTIAALVGSVLLTIALRR